MESTINSVINIAYRSSARFSGSPEDNWGAVIREFPYVILLKL